MSVSDGSRDEAGVKLPGLSFVFPMYNEIGNIETCVAEALRVGRLVTDDLEIVVVDDASTDGCGALADSLALKHPELKVIHNERNRKLGGTLRTGLRRRRGTGCCISTAICRSGWTIR